MPTNLRKRVIAHRTQDTNLAIQEYLLTGHWWSFLVPRGLDPARPPDDYLRDIWRRNRTAFLESYPDCWAARNFDVEPDRSVRAWERWIRSDLDRSAVAKGYYFDEHAADRAVKFFERFLRHSVGRWEGKPFRLSRWQIEKFIMPSYGWKRPDGSRRFRVIFVFIPKKNGKSTLCSGLCLYHLIGDGESSARVYCGAVDRQQAGEVFDGSVSIVSKSPILAKRLRITESRKFISDPWTRSLYHAMSADAFRQEGLNVSATVIDELHVHKNSEMIDTLRYGGAARRQPIMIILTTSGEDRSGPWWEELSYARKVANGTLEDLEYLPLLFGADEQKDKENPEYWKDPETWYAANPSLGETLSEEDMRQDCQKAQGNPRLMGIFKRYRLNLPGYKDSKWIPMDRWNQCKGDGAWLPLDFAPQKKPIQAPPALAGRYCNAGLDLSSVTDLTAFVLDFPIQQEDKTYHVWLPYFFSPEETAYARSKKDRRPYLEWSEKGLLELTPGASVDYGYVKDRILQIAKFFDIRLIALDPWNGRHMQTLLAESGLNVIEFRQGFGSMTTPCKLLETTIRSKTLVHSGHAVLTDHAGNIVVRTDAAENCKPDKEKSSERIDGVVAGLMALDCSHRQPVPIAPYDGTLLLI